MVDKVKFTELFAFLAEDELGEGLVAMPTPNGMMPLVGGDMEMAMQLRPAAQKIARISGKKIRLVHFRARLDLEEIT